MSRRGRSASKPQTKPAPAASKDTKKRGASKADPVTYKAESYHIIYRADQEDRVTLAKLLEDFTEKSTTGRALILAKSTAKGEANKYKEDAEDTINDTDILLEAEVKVTKSKAKKNPQTLYEIDASLIEKAKKLAANLDKKLAKNKAETSEESSQSEKSNEESEEEEVVEKKPTKKGKQQPKRTIKKITGKLAKDSTKEEKKSDDGKIKDEKEESAKRTTRRAAGGKKNEVVSKPVKKSKTSATQSKTTKKVDLDESKEDEDYVESPEESGPDSDEDFGDEEVEEKKTKGKKSASKKASDKSPKKKSAKAGKPYKKGKFNTNVKLIEKCNYLEDSSNNPIDYGNAKNNNKNLYRAVYTKNHTLLEKVLEKQNFMSNIFEPWAPENSLNAFELAIKNNDVKALKMILECLTKKTITLAPIPSINLQHVDTGYVSRQAFGTRVRKVAMARGGREGNNALVQDQGYDNSLYTAIEEFNKGYLSVETFELLRIHQGDHEAMNWAHDIVMSGNLKLVSHIVEYAIKVGGWDFNFLHQEALSKKEPKDMTQKIRKVSVLKKSSTLQGATPLHLACINPNADVLEYLLGIEPEYNFPDSQARKLVHYAACCSGDGPLKLLLSKNVQVNEADKNGLTPLMYASHYGRIENVELLLGHVDINLKAKQRDGTTAFHWAVQNGHLDVVKAFHKHKFDLNAKGRFRMTPLLIASAYGHFEIVEYLLENGAKILDKDKYKRNSVVLAARNGNLKILSYLLSRGGQFDAPDSSNNFAIHYAAAYGFTECIQVLVDAGADINEKNSWNLTPLAVAMLKKNYHCVDVLLSYSKIDVNCKDDNGRTLVSQILNDINEKNFEQLKLLIKEKHADIKIADTKGNSPLHHLCQIKVKDLVQRDRNTHQMPEEEKKIKIDEKQAIKIQILDLLIQNGADVNHRNFDGKVPIQSAFESYDDEVILRLLEQPQTDLLFKDSSGNTIYSMLVTHILTEESAFSLFNKILKKIGNKNDILNEKNSQNQNSLCQYLTRFISSIHTVYNSRESLEKSQMTIQERIKQNLSPTAHITLTKKQNEECEKIALDYFNKIIKNCIEVLNCLLKAGASIPEKPYPLYQQIGNATGPFLVWLFENFSPDVCNYNEVETENKEEKYKRKWTPIHFLLTSFSMSNTCYVSKREELEKYVERVTSSKLGHKSDFYLILSLYKSNNVDFKLNDAANNSPLMSFLNSYSGLSHKDLFADLYSFEHDIHIQNSNEDNALLIAARKGWTEIVDTLVKDGADRNSRNKVGNTVLHFYVDRGNAREVERILQLKFDPNIIDKEGRTPLHLAINNSHPEDMFEVESLLIRNGSNLNLRDEDGRSPLHFAFCKISSKHRTTGPNRSINISEDPIEAVSSLCATDKILLNIRDRRGRTPLHYAASRGAYISLLFLLDKKVELDVKDADGNTPLGLALAGGHKDTAATLIQNKSSIDAKLYPIDERRLLVEKKKNGEMATESEETELIPGTVSVIKKRRNDDDGEDEDEDYDNDDYSDGYEEIELPTTSTKDSFFAFAIRKNWQGIAYLLLRQGYSLREAIKDALNEKQFKYVIALMNKVFDDKILKDIDERRQNLFHIFAIKGAQAPQDLTIKIFEELQRRGVDMNAFDDQGRTPLHYAAETNFNFLERKLLEFGCDPNTQDSLGRTPFTVALTSGKLTYEHARLFLDYKYDIKTKFFFNIRGMDMEIGPLVYLMYSECKDLKLIKLFIENGSTVNDRDDEGWTPVIYAIRQNNMELLEYFLTCPGLRRDMADFDGQTPIHHVVNPLEYGSYENIAMLEKLAVFFDVNKADKRGRTPIQNAYLQDSGVMVNALKLRGSIDNKPKSNLKRQATSIISSVEWAEEVDYEDDANKYIEEEQKKDSIVREETPVAPDRNAAGKNLKVVYDDKLGPYSLFMTKVDVKKGGFGEYLFYRMQVLHDTNQNVFILFTRWGRIGENGAYQNTPFNTSDACIKEFKKIFHDKSQNEWENKEAFVKKPNKYKLINIEKNQKSANDYLKPFDWKDEKLPKSELAAEIVDVMKGIANVKVYHRCFLDLRIDQEALPFGRITKDLLFEAKGLLLDLKNHIEDLNKARENLADINLDKVLEIRELIADKSSRFFELIPDQKFRFQPVKPIDDFNTLNLKVRVVESLIDYEISSKILLGAHFNINKVNPADYCFSALNIKLLPLTNESPELQVIKEYIKNGWKNFKDDDIVNIFGLERKGEAERISQWKNLKNRTYLWHGSKLSNFMGILNQGLRIAPPEAPATGYMFGKGVYFADCIQKSLGYCNDPAARNEGVQYRLLLICEVALGEMYEARRAEYIEELKAPYKSVKGLGSYGPNHNQSVTLVNGAKVPIGKCENYEYYDIKDGKKERYHPGLSYNEYIVYDASQIRMRYLVQVKI